MDNINPLLFIYGLMLGGAIITLLALISHIAQTDVNNPVSGRAIVFLSLIPLVAIWASGPGYASLFGMARTMDQLNIVLHGEILGTVCVILLFLLLHQWYIGGYRWFEVLVATFFVFVIFFMVTGTATALYINTVLL